MLLSDRDIRAEIAANRVGVEPFEEAMIQPSSVDVRLDKFFRVFENHKYSVIDPSTEQAELTREVIAEGDEPFISKDALEKVIALFNNSMVDVGSLILPITNNDTIQNPNCVKVVVDKNFKAMYFSRSPIPYVRDEKSNQQFYKHIGVYAFKKESLLAFTQMPISQLERTEKLENLRMLENGMNVYMAVVNEIGISIDTPEDFELAKKYLTQSGY